MPLPAAVRRPRRGGVAQGFSEPPASLVRCIGPWGRGTATRPGTFPSTGGAGLHLVAILPHARRCDAGAVSGDCERPNHPHAPDPTVEIGRCCVVRRMCTRANSGRAGGCEKCLAISPKNEGRNTFLLHRRCVFAVPSIFLFFSEPTLGLVSRSACVWVLAL